MSARQQSKKARFANEMREQRVTNRIFAANRHKPGFLGVVRNFKVKVNDTTSIVMGRGAIFKDRSAS